MKRTSKLRIALPPQNKRCIARRIVNIRIAGLPRGSTLYWCTIVPDYSQSVTGCVCSPAGIVHIWGLSALTFWEKGDQKASGGTFVPDGFDSYRCAIKLSPTQSITLVPASLFALIMRLGETPVRA